MIIEDAKSAEAVFFLFKPPGPSFLRGETIDEQVKLHPGNSLSTVFSPLVYGLSLKGSPDELSSMIRSAFKERQEMRARAQQGKRFSRYLRNAWVKKQN